MYHKNEMLYNSSPAQQQHVDQQFCNSQLQLSISARKLLNKDIVSKSDPQCVLYQFVGNKYVEIGRTEVIKDNLNPDWVKKFTIPYYFNVKQQFRFEIWDFDPISSNEFLGRTDVTLAEVVAANGGVYKRPLKTGLVNFNRDGGEIWLQAEELSGNKQIATIQFSASNLDKKDFFGKSDPYLVIYRSNRDGTWSAVHKTEVIKRCLSPVWRPFNIRVQTLCNGDYDRDLKIDCYDWDDGTNDDLIGSFVTSLKRLTTGGNDQNTYDCINEKKKNKKKSYKNSGTIKLNMIRIETEVTFLDYIKAGTQMHFAVSVDFTASNGPPNDPRSLHRLDPTGENPNSYEIALKAVGEILQPYDTQGLMAAFGFGAKIGPYGQLSHHFPLNNNASFPYCRGIDEVLSGYKSTLESVTLHGPTNFAPSINYAANVARGLQDGKHYFVLLIITDGVITDMNETIEAIVSASSLPFSLIIVGVGGADFSAMEFLDADRHALVSRGRRAVRDIVQFVPLRNYSKGHWIQHQSELARDVLAEIPTQFIQFMNSRGFKPGMHSNSSTSSTSFPEPGSDSWSQSSNSFAPNISTQYQGYAPQSAQSPSAQAPQSPYNTQNVPNSQYAMNPSAPQI